MQAAGGGDLFGVDDTMFADLKLSALIAQGGQTRVWRGEWQAGAVPVAVKILSQGGPSNSPEALRSFVQESRAQAACIAVVVTGGSPYPCLYP